VTMTRSALTAAKQAVILVGGSQTCMAFRCQLPSVLQTLSGRYGAGGLVVWLRHDVCVSAAWGYPHRTMGQALLRGCR
jgi:hypothetical protein